MTGVEQVVIGIFILVVGGLLLAGARKGMDYLSDAVAAKLVKSINGQLGLDKVRDDIAELKDEVHAAATDRKNLQQQLEALLTDGR